MSIREDVELYTKLSGEDGSQETIATIGAYLRGYRQGKEDAEPHWIPVTERLPETGQDVELCCGYKNYRGEIVRYICIAYHVNRYEMKYSADWDEGCDEYREEDDEYYILEGWYERIHNWDTYGAVKIDDLALAWRELPNLPEPFKGVTE